MKFGYGLITCQRHPDDARPDRELYAEAIALAEEAERLGFDSVWTSEHHFGDDAYMPSLLVLMAAIAARTARVEIGSGVLLAPLYPPLRLAEDAATVDLLSGGRLALGLGLGWLPWQFDAFAIPFAERVHRTIEAIRVCRQAWGPGLVEGTGVAVTPKPARPGGPPIWLGAEAEPAVRRAARLADGWMANAPDRDAFREQVGWLRAELGAAGRDPAAVEVAGHWPVFAWDGSDAFERVRPHLRYMLWKYDDSELARGRLGPLSSPPPLLPDEPISRPDAPPGSGARAHLICGRPDEVAMGIRELAAIAGPRFHFVARLYYPGMDREVMRRSTRLFAEGVIPRLRGQ